MGKKIVRLGSQTAVERSEEAAKMFKDSIIDLSVSRISPKITQTIQEMSKDFPELLKHFSRSGSPYPNVSIKRFVELTLRGEEKRVIPVFAGLRIPLRNLASTIKELGKTERDLATAFLGLATGKLEQLKSAKDMALRRMAVQLMALAHALARKQGKDDVREIFSTEGFSNCYASLGTEREMTVLKRLGLKQTDLVHGYREVEKTIQKLKDVAWREKYNLALIDARTAISLPSTLASKPVKNKIPPGFAAARMAERSIKAVEEAAKEQEEERRKERERRKKRRKALAKKRAKPKKKKKA